MSVGTDTVVPSAACDIDRFTTVEGTLSDADLAAYDSALDAFLAGDWATAYKHLHRVPPDDRGKDVLTEFILKNNRTPPTNWSGVIPMGSKG